MNSKHLLMMLLLVVLLCVGLTTLFYSFYVIEDKRVVPMDIKVSDHGGFNLDTDAMHFGLAAAGDTPERSLFISHDSDHPLLVEIRFYGEFADWVEPSENSFVLEPGEQKEVFFKVYVPGGMEHKQYNGTIVIFFKRILF